MFIVSLDGGTQGHYLPREQSDRNPSQDPPCGSCVWKKSSWLKSLTKLEDWIIANILANNSYIIQNLGLAVGGYSITAEFN